MDVLFINTEPNPTAIPNYIVSNYRQIRFVVVADSFVPPDQPMYADIYLGPSLIFYKTIASYTIDTVGGSGNSIFMFDIQDAIQEYLQTYIISSTNVIGVVGQILRSDIASNQSECDCIVYFRGSSIVSGLLVPNPTVPIQGTATTSPVTGTGTPCEQFKVVNSSIIDVFETIYNNDLELFLAGLVVQDATILPGTRCLPLSNLPNNPLLTPNLNKVVNQYMGNNAGFPFILLEFGISGMLDRFTRNCILYVGVSTDYIHYGYYIATTLASSLSAGHTYYLPIGLKDLKNIMNPADYTILEDTIKPSSYRLSIWDQDSGSWVFHTPLFRVCKTTLNSVNLLFQNMYGHFENVTFVRSAKDLDTNSSELFTPYTQTVRRANDPLGVGRKRYNTRGSNTFTLTVLMNEELMDWFQELFLSPYILMQTVPDYTGRHTLIAVKIVDGSIKIKETVDKAGKKYIITIKVIPAIDFIIPRN